MSLQRRASWSDGIDTYAGVRNKDEDTELNVVDQESDNDQTKLMRGVDKEEEGVNNAPGYNSKVEGDDWVNYLLGR